MYQKYFYFLTTVYFSTLYDALYQFSQWSNHTVALIQLLFGSIPTLFYLTSDFHMIVILLTVSKVKLATVVEGDQKAPFSTATTPRCKGGRYSFPWIAPLYP